MKKISLFLFGIILSIGLVAQIPGNPNANGTIEAGPPFEATGITTGGGEMQLQLQYIQSSVDSMETLLVTDSIATAAMYYTNTYWNDLKAPFSTAKRGQTNKPDFDFDNVGLLFPQNDTTEIIYMILQFSHERAPGSDISPHVHWQQMNSNDVVWKLAYKWFDNGDAVPANWTFLTEDHDIFTYSSGSMLQITDFPTITGTSITGVSSIFLVKVYRDDNVDAGAGSGDALGFEFDLHWQSNGPGSADEYNK